MRVLIVEDHRDVADTLQMGLEEYGYQVSVTRDGIDGELKARTGEYDLLVVDWMLPGQDGTRLIQRLRNEGVDTPVLMLTARAEKQDQIDALDLGADDYLAKPFSFEVLLARLRALARRAAATPPDPEAHMRLEAGPLRIDLRQRTATLGTAQLDLRTKEYQVLVLLAEHPNHVLTRTIIAERAWDSIFVTDDVLNTTIGSLRRKLREADADAGGGIHPLEIETVRGVGYRLKVPPALFDRAAA